MVKHEKYEEALNALRQMKEQVIEQYAKSEDERKVWEEVLPFET